MDQTMSQDIVLLEKKGNIAIMTLNNPKTLNALSTKMFKAINEALDKVVSDKNIFVLIITGTGKSFIAGADITEMVNLTAAQAIEWGPQGSDINTKIENLRIPVIAAVNGYALGGGCELALSCDIRVAADTAVFGLPEVGLGVIPGFGGTQRLPRIVGAGVAKELIYTARKIDAQEALRIDLVNYVVPKEELIDKAMEIAKKITVNAQHAIQEAKKAITKGLEVDKLSGLAYESQIFALCFATEDQKIGMRAFVNKEKEKNFKYK